MTFNGGILAGIIILILGVLEIRRGYFGEHREVWLKTKNKDDQSGSAPYWSEKIRRSRIAGVTFCIIGTVLLLIQLVR